MRVQGITSSHLRLTLAVAVAGLLGGTLGCDRRGTPELKLAHAASPGSLVALCADEFARRANQRLGDRAKVIVYAAGTLGSDELVLQKLKLQTVDIGVNSTVMSSVVDEFALFEMPYLVQDRDHMRRIERAVFWPILAPRAEAHGYRVLALWENGFRHLTNDTRPIVTPNDLQGLKLRTPGSPWRMKLFQTLGAKPSPLPFHDLFLALRTGMMDGQENPLSNIVGGSLYEVQSYLTLSAHLYSPAFVVMSAAGFRALPEEVQTVLEEAAKATQAFAFSMAEELDSRLLEQLRASGMQVNEPDRASFAAASRPMYDEFGAKVPRGREMIETARALRGTNQ